jgi:hypothetical protein
MPTSTLTTVSDVSISGWTKNGFSGTYAAALSDGSDSTYMAYAGAGGVATLNLSALPGGAGTITGITIRLRCYVNSTKNNPKITAQIKASGGGALSGSVQFSATTSFSNISQTATVSDGNPSDWGSATIVITSDGNAAENVSEVLGVDVTYGSDVIYSDSGVTSGAVQTTGLIGLTPAFVIGQATIGSRNFW